MTRKKIGTPFVQLSGKDGNVFSIIGRCASEGVESLPSPVSIAPGDLPTTGRA